MAEVIEKKKLNKEAKPGQVRVEWPVIICNGCKQEFVEVSDYRKHAYTFPNTGKTEKDEKGNVSVISPHDEYTTRIEWEYRDADPNAKVE